MYSGKRIQIPAPRFVVFYNGTEEQPERKILRLSESFYRQTEEGAVWERSRLLASMMARGLSPEEISELTGEQVETIQEASETEWYSS